MVGDRYRILELALESLENRKKRLDAEIADIRRDLRKSASRKAPAPAKSVKAGAAAKRPRFSKAERLRRSRRMKAYWESRRKKKVNPK